jgi:hypothetical protein
MRDPIIGGFVAFTLLMSQLSPASLQVMPNTDSTKVINRVGRFYSPNRRCLASIKISSMGGMLVLNLDKDPGHQIEDVTGIAWISGRTLVYTTSPIYGTPGVYVYSCDSKQSRRIVAPRTINNAYPDGADYFRLQGISQATPTTVYFYYVSDVESLDVKTLESPTHLFRVHLDGTGFGRSE